MVTSKPAWAVASFRNTASNCGLVNIALQLLMARLARARAYTLLVCPISASVRVRIQLEPGLLPWTANHTISPGRGIGGLNVNRPTYAPPPVATGKLLSVPATAAPGRLLLLE